MGPMDDPQRLLGNLAPASFVNSHVTRDSQVQNHDALTRCHTVSPLSGDNQLQEHFPQPARASCQQGRSPTVATLPTNAPQTPFQLIPVLLGQQYWASHSQRQRRDLENS